MDATIIFSKLRRALLIRNRRPGGSRDPVGAQKTWIPACAGMGAKPGLGPRSGAFSAAGDSKGIHAITLI